MVRRLSKCKKLGDRAARRSAMPRQLPPSPAAASEAQRLKLRFWHIGDQPGIHFQHCSLLMPRAEMRIQIPNWTTRQTSRRCPVLPVLPASTAGTPAPEAKVNDGTQLALSRLEEHDLAVHRRPMAPLLAVTPSPAKSCGRLQDKAPAFGCYYSQVFLTIGSRSRSVGPSLSQASWSLRHP